MNTILKEAFRTGRKSADQDPQAQQERREYVREKTQAYATEKIEKLKIQGARLAEERKGLREEIAHLLMNRPLAAHRQNYLMGCAYLAIFLLILACEFALIRWCFSPYDFKLESYILALTLTLAAATTFEFYLRYLQQRDPQGYSRHRLWLVFGAVILFTSSILLLSYNRAALMSASKHGEALESQVNTANRFYAHSTFLYAAIVLGALAVVLLSGILLQEALSRFSISGPVLRLNRRLNILETTIASILSEIKQIETLPQKAVAEFERGRFAGPESPIHPILNPVSILILALLLVLALAIFAKAEELSSSSVILLLDMSGSMQGADYLEKTEFQKNVLYVEEIIKKLEPGTHFRILGITEKSFEKPLLVLDKTITKESGYFSEKTAKDKLSIMNEWKKQTIQANAKDTDLFSALLLAMLMFDKESAGKKLFVLSDMRNSVGIDLETPQLIGESLIQDAEKNGLVADLHGVDVWAIGVSTINKSYPYWNSLRSFWAKYFEIAGAHLVAYNAERKWDTSEKTK